MTGVAPAAPQPAADPFGFATADATDTPPPADPLRVRLLYTRYPHWGAHSGMYQFARHLDPRRTRVTTWSASDSDDDLPMPRGAARERLRHAVQQRGMAWYKLSDLAAELRALGRCGTGDAEVVHFLDGEHGAQFLPMLLRPARAAGGRRARAQALARLVAPAIGRARTVATFHQPPDVLDQCVNRALLENLDLATAVAPTQLPWLLEVLPPERVALIPHGVDTTFFRPAARDEAPRWPDAPFRLITAGHWLRDWEAMAAVVDALADAPDLEFHVVTSRTTGLEQRARVFHHRSVDDATLLALYQRADALLLPLIGSTANNSLLEGTACGLPAITTDLPAVRAYLPGAQGLFSAPGDHAALADAVLLLQRDADLRAAQSRAARARAEQLAWPLVARHVQRVYDRVAATRPPHQGG